MNVLVVGSGGREHALVHFISESPSVVKIYAAPGNAGTAERAENISVAQSDFSALRDFCLKEKIDLVVVGPENPLAGGLADVLRERGITVFGPNRDAARLESSKGYARRFMKKYGIPHPSFQVFSDVDEAKAHVKSTDGPWVIKADGLALGKGVSVCQDREEALSRLEWMMSGQAFGDAGKTVLIEEYISGVEMTAMALCDGVSFNLLPFSKDHKRAHDGDKGPMTGGMGAISPVPFADEELRRQVEEIVARTVEGLNREGLEYRGLLYIGLMVDTDGLPRVLEYNVRFGDPETECILPRLTGDLAVALMACAKGTLDEVSLGERVESCATVVMASNGYPEKYSTGFEISGLDRDREEGVFMFHAGTRREQGRYYTSGGRVLAVSALGTTLDQAVRKAYRAVDSISYANAYFRKDIGVI